MATDLLEEYARLAHLPVKSTEYQAVLIVG
jgi:hypothetical protein